MSCPVSGHHTSEGVCPAATHQQDSQNEVHNAIEASAQLEDIPQPPQHLFGLLGNIPDVDSSFLPKDMWRLQKIYGPIMKLKLGLDRVFVGSQPLVNEICDPTRFEKIPANALLEVRALTGDGLFTAFHEEPNWGKAHRMLIPTFGKKS